MRIRQSDRFTPCPSCDSYLWTRHLLMMPPTWQQITRSGDPTLCLWHWLDNSAYHSSLSTNTSSSSHRLSLSQSGPELYVSVSRYMLSAICYLLSDPLLAPLLAETL